ncbi:hypothetical protein JCM17961_37220 [Endothiovibrio diazotrophicus]
MSRGFSKGTQTQRAKNPHQSAKSAGRDASVSGAGVSCSKEKEIAGGGQPDTHRDRQHHHPQHETGKCIGAA